MAIILFATAATAMVKPGGTTRVAFGEQDFLLVNSTGVEINALYVTPHSAKKWGEDILGADTLPDGEDLLILFPDKTKSKFWDLRIEDEDGDFIEWDNLNLLKISRVELFFKKGVPTADLQ
jgi:hypothetical protein